MGIDPFRVDAEHPNRETRCSVAGIARTRLPLAAFIAILNQARHLTHERSGTAGELTGASGRQHHMVAFFSVLEALLEDL